MKRLTDLIKTKINLKKLKNLVDMKRTEKVKLIEKRILTGIIEIVEIITDILIKMTTNMKKELKIDLINSIEIKTLILIDIAILIVI